MIAGALLLSATWILSASEPSVEIKLPIDDVSYETLAEGAEAPEEREVYFILADGLAIYQAGVLLRIRLRGDRIQSTVKLRGLSEADFNDLASDGYGSRYKYKCEVDLVLGGSEKRSCSLSTHFEMQPISGSPAGFFTRRQERFAADRLGLRRSEFKDNLRSMHFAGPVQSTAFELALDGPHYPETVDVEQWFFGGERFAEVSSKGPIDEQEPLRAGVEWFVRDFNLSARGDSQSKTAWFVERWSAGRR